MTSQSVVAVGAVLVVLSASAAEAQVKAGPEFRANTFVTSYQFAPAMSVQPGGDFVVVWTSYAQDGSYYGIFGQRFARDGAPRGAEFQANTFTTNYQVWPDVSANKAGSFVVVWESQGQDGSYSGIFGQRYDAAGVRAGVEFQANADTAGYQLRGSVAVDGRGNFVVVWSSSEGDGPGNYGIRGQRFDANGVRRGAEFSVNTYTTNVQYLANVAGAPDGRFVVVWGGNVQDGSGYGVFGQRFDATGAKVGAEFQVNTYTTGHQQDPSVNMTADGRFIVAWESDEGAAAVEIRSQRYDSAGNRVGGEFAVNTYTTGSQFIYGIAQDAQGNYVVAWDDVDRDGDDWGVYGWRLTSANARRGTEFQANTTTTGYQGYTQLGSDEVGNYVVAWNGMGPGDTFGIFFQRFGGLFPHALGVNTGGNQVWEPGETVDVRPFWRNHNGAAVTFGGTLASLSGPAGAIYTLSDGTGSYGTVPSEATAPCLDCYQVAVNNPATRPVQHWDASALESITPDTQGQQKRWTLHIGASFSDVPGANPFYRFIETLLHHGITSGCSGTAYCPISSTTREQMAVFVLVAKEGAGYGPPACGATPVFADVPVTSGFCRWVEELARRGVVTGCGPGLYCPTAPVTREQMAVFVLRVLDPALQPPACTTPVFADVPASSGFCRWIEELFRRSVVTGCGGGNYCPTSPVTREQMGVFIGVTFGLSLYGP